MKKNKWVYLYLFLKVSLISCMLFFFVCGDIRGGSMIAYAINAKRDLTLPLLPVSLPLLNSDPAPTPTPVSSPSPTSAASQTPQATQVSQGSPVPTRDAVPPVPAATRSAVATPTKPTMSATAPAGGTTVIPPFLTHPFWHGVKDMNAFTLFLTLGVGGPLLLIIGGILWLLVRRQMKMLTVSPNVASGYIPRGDSSSSPIGSSEPTGDTESNDNGPPASPKAAVETLPASREEGACYP